MSAGSPEAPVGVTANAPVDVLTLGEAMMSLRAQGRIRLGAPMLTSIAGAEANLAIGLARLGHRVRWTGRVGADEAGELVLRTLRAEGVLVDCVVRDPEAATGIILFEQRLPDVTRVDYHRDHSAGSRLQPDDLHAALAATGRVLHVSGITPALSVTAHRAVVHAVEVSRAHGLLVCLDLNFRSRLWPAAEAAPVLRELAELADLVIASADELALVADDPADLLERGPREVVVKLGADGARAHTAEEEVHVAAHRVSVVDSIGAGDAFCAGYLSALLDGADLRGRLARGNAVGAFAVTGSGDWESLPTRAELPLLASPGGTALR